MDVDMLKSSALAGDDDDDDDHHLDMMTMMMQMEKPPPPHPHQQFLQDIDFSSAPPPPPPPAASSSPSPPIVFNNTHPVIPGSGSQPGSVCNFMGNNNPIAMTPLPPPPPPPPHSQLPISNYEKRNSMAAMREMIFRIAAMQPIHIDPESIKAPKRRNVKISKDPQSVAARHRRERISERIRILQRLVPGGTKMDTASMLDEAIHYVKFLKKQVQTLQQANRTVLHHHHHQHHQPPLLLGTTTTTSHLGSFSSASPQLLGNTSNFVNSNYSDFIKPTTSHHQIHMLG